MLEKEFPMSLNVKENKAELSLAENVIKLMLG